MKKKTKIIGYTIGIVLFVVMLAGITYAMYRKVLYNVNVASTADNLDEYIIYSKGVSISSGTLMPTDNYTNGASATVTFYKSNTSPYNNIFGHIYLDINSMSMALSQELKYTVVDNNNSNVIGEGSFYTYVSGTSLPVAYNIPLGTTQATYTIYVWLDEELYAVNTANNTFDIDIRCSATMKTITEDYIDVSVPEINTAADYVKYLYSNHAKTTATVNNITYNLAPSVNLMNDRHASMSTDINGGDIRYYGANPNNYVWLGDTFTSNYSYSSNGGTVTRTSGDKKLWRIIGVFDGRLKLISNDPISATNLSWDTSANNKTGGNYGCGINQWGESTYSDTGNVYEGADLMRLLNPGYEDTAVNNSLYWNKGTGTVYSGQSNATTANVNFANTGLSVSERNMIDIVTWYLGASTFNTSDRFYVDTRYNAERQSATLGKICSSGNYCNDKVVRTATWNGKVGLIYPSDMGYAVDFSVCTRSMYDFNRECKINDWLIDTSRVNATISPEANSARSTGIFYVYTIVSTSSASSTRVFLPVIYIKPNVVITEGNGSEDNPYVLSLG